MKIKRQKHLRRCLTFYKNNFGFQPPYRVLLDGTFCKAALTFKINISEQLPKYLDGEVQLCTTKCCIAECEALGSILYGPLKVLRQFHVHHCHHDPPVSAKKCMHAAIKKSGEKFFLGTQDPELTSIVRSRGGIPLLFISFNAITMEAPSETSKEIAENRVQTMIAPSDHDQTVIKKLKTETFGEEEVKKKKKRRGPKGPNPLSCKKKKNRKSDELCKSKKKKLKRKARLQQSVIKL
ncbi:hypothetical protein ACJMK2_041657 [Sinanodonta woodiana]|uniref:rRNA-processing protein UTP23 homolog n=1 Tax=Sinanodonta woodiana TaxID=1069815 RepID=A0ABD3W679_SINWO